MRRTTEGKLCSSRACTPVEETPFSLEQGEELSLAVPVSAQPCLSHMKAEVGMLRGWWGGARASCLQAAMVFYSQLLVACSVPALQLEITLGLGKMTSEGPFQPAAFCDCVNRPCREHISAAFIITEYLELEGTTRTTESNSHRELHGLSTWQVTSSLPLASVKLEGAYLQPLSGHAWFAGSALWQVLRVLTAPRVINPTWDASRSSESVESILLVFSFASAGGSFHLYFPSWFV